MVKSRAYTAPAIAMPAKVEAIPQSTARFNGVMTFSPYVAASILSAMVRPRPMQGRSLAASPARPSGTMAMRHEGRLGLGAARRYPTNWSVRRGTGTSRWT